MKQLRQVSVFVLVGMLWTGWFGSSALYADLVTLNNGDEIFGSISEASAEKVVVLKDGQPLQYVASQVMKIEFETFRMIPGEHAPESVTDPVIRRYLDAPFSETEYPEALRVFLRDEDRLDIDREGTFTLARHHTFVILKETGREAANRSFSYFPDMENFAIAHARSITPGKPGVLGLMGQKGSVHYLSDRTIADETDFSDTPLYARRHTVQFAVPEVGPGSVVDVLFRVNRFKPDPLKPFFFEKIMQGWEPKRLSRLEIRVPKGLRLLFSVEENGIPVSIAQREDGDFLIHTFEASDTPAILEEPLMPGISRMAPRVVCSLEDTWENIARRYHTLLEAKARVAVDDSLLKDLTAKICGPVPDVEGKVRALFGYVAREIELLPISPSEFSHEPIDPVKVFHARQGTMADKAFFYHVLLSIAGIEHSLALVSPFDDGAWRSDVPCLLQGSYLAVEIPGVSGVLSINLPVSQDQSPQVRPTFLQGAAGIRLPSGQPFAIPQVEAEGEGESTRINAGIAENGTLTMEIWSHPRGAMETGYRALKAKRRDELAKMFQQIFHREFPGARLQDFSFTNLEDLNKPVEGYFRLEVPNFALRSGGDLLVIPLPVNKSDYSTANVGAPERRVDLAWSQYYANDQRITLRLPPGYVPYALPEGVISQADGMSYFSAFGFEIDRVTFRDAYRRTIRTLPAGKYVDYRRFIEKMSETADQWIVVKKK
jgi:hypothetical protein